MVLSAGVVPVLVESEFVDAGGVAAPQPASSSRQRQSAAAMNLFFICSSSNCFLYDEYSPFLY